MAGHGEARRGLAGRGEARHGNLFNDSGAAGQGQARQGPARSGWAWLGEARHGNLSRLRQGVAW